MVHLTLARALLTTAPLVRWPRNAAPLACAAFKDFDVRPRLTNWLDSSIEAEGRRRASLEKEEKAAQKAERLSQWATLVVANLYRIPSTVDSFIVEDWENGGRPVELRFAAGEGTPKEQADAAFKKARRMRRGSAVVATLLQESDVRVRKLTSWRERVMAAVGTAKERDDHALQDLHAEVLREAKKLKLKVDELSVDTPLRPTLPRGSRDGLQQSGIAPSQTSGWSGREFLSPNGVPILVGRNRAENERLSLKVARDPDVWMHVRGSPGAHVVLQMSRIRGPRTRPSDECMQMAADLAAFYSEMRDENKVLVTYTSPRHITKPKGA